MPWLEIGAVSLGAVVGSLLRWGAGLWLNARWAGFPLGTLFVNCVGGLAIGAVLFWLEHYPGMTERAIESMIDEAMRRFAIRRARVIHRIGLLQPRDQIVLVAVTSGHRRAAFEACEFLMDYLKTQAPFWKKEQTPEGARWVDARVSDDAALARWGITASNT